MLCGQALGGGFWLVTFGCQHPVGSHWCRSGGCFRAWALGVLVTTELLIGAPSRGSASPPSISVGGRKGAQALFLEHTPRSFCRSWANHLLGTHFPSWDLSVLPLKLGWFISMCLKRAHGALCWGCFPLPTSHGAGLRGVGLFGYHPCGSGQHLLPSSSRPVPLGLGEALLTRPGEGVAHVTLLAAALLCAASSGGRCTAERPHPSADAAWPPGNGAEPRAAGRPSPACGMVSLGQMGQLGALMPQGLPQCWGCGAKPSAVATQQGASIPGFPGLQLWTVHALHPCERRERLHIPQDVEAGERVVLVGHAPVTALCQCLEGAGRWTGVPEGGGDG